MNTWQLQTAKARFSEVIQRTMNEGAQLVTLHGKPSVILISVEEYQQLTQPKKSLISLIQDSPLRGLELDIQRSAEKTPDGDLFL